MVRVLRKILALSSKHARRRVPNPMKILDKCHKALLGCRKGLVESPLTGDLLSYVGHSVLVQKGSTEVRKNRFEQKERMIATIKSQETPLAKRRPERAALAGAWLTVVPDILNGTTLSPDNFWYNLHLRFGLELLGPNVD